jgi:hypothetical protein
MPTLAVWQQYAESTPATREPTPEENPELYTEGGLPTSGKSMKPTVSVFTANRDPPHAMSLMVDFLFRS